MPAKTSTKPRKSKPVQTSAAFGAPSSARQNKFVRALRELATAERATSNRRFFKTGPGEYGEGDKFLGITVPDTRSVVKKFNAALTIADAEALLASPWHEVRLAALILLVAKYENGNDDERTSIFALYLKALAGGRINNWDLIDTSAGQIVGAHCVTLNDWSLLRKLETSKYLWERRVAIIATFAYLKIGSAEPSLKIAAALLGDDHDLMHKAAGWVLREVGKQCGVDLLRDFLRAHVAYMPRTMLRYAIERLPEPERKKWLRA